MNDSNIMSTKYTGDQVRLMFLAKSLKRNLKKGDFIYIPQDDLSHIEDILRSNDIPFSRLPPSAEAIILQIV